MFYSSDKRFVQTIIFKLIDFRTWSPIHYKLPIPMNKIISFISKVAPSIFKYLSIIFFVGAFISFLFIVFNPVYFNTSWTIDTELAAHFGDFFGGFVGVMFSILSTLLLIYSISNQFIERQKRWATDNFYKMVEFHNNIVNQLTISNIYLTKRERSNGRRAFVIFKIQINHLLEVINRLNKQLHWGIQPMQTLHIAYIIFYYGISESWHSFLLDKIKVEEIHKGRILDNIEYTIDKIRKEKNLSLGRTNQTSLSSYFRNMYNLIKLVDENKFLSQQEKKDLITIYRTQLSNPELYVLFFHIASECGKGLLIYTKKYELLNDIPKGYCNEYDPMEVYNIKYEFEE